MILNQVKYSTISTIKLPGVTGEDLCKTEVETKIKKNCFYRVTYYQELKET